MDSHFYKYLIGQDLQDFEDHFISHRFPEESDETQSSL
jgi:hypothetical protein